MRTTRTPRQETLMPPTHDVFNQSPALVGYDVADDPAMLSALRREGGGWAEEAVRELGRRAGSARRPDLGREGNEKPPGLPGGLGPRPGSRPRGKREPAGAAHARPLREPGRRGGVPPGLARADDGGGAARLARRPVAGQPSRGARGAGGRLL